MSNTTPVHYTWVSHLLEADESAREERTYTLGGEVPLLHVEYQTNEDDTMDLTVLSVGPQSRQALSHLVNLLQSVVAQDAMEYEAEQREKRARAEEHKSDE